MGFLRRAAHVRTLLAAAFAPPPPPSSPRRALRPAQASETTVPSAGVSASSTVPSVMMTLSKRNHPR